MSLFERKFWKLLTLREIWVEYWFAGDRIDGDLPLGCLQIITKKNLEIEVWSREVSISLKVRVDERIRRIWNESESLLAISWVGLCSRCGMLHKYGHMEESPFVFDQARRSMIGSKVGEPNSSVCFC